MPKIISFAWTTPALIAGFKTVTRRQWNARYAGSFKTGDLVQAWDKSPRTGKGQRVGWIRLTKDPYLEITQDMPDSDYEAEGFEYLYRNRARGSPPMGTSPADFYEWKAAGELYWVVRFEWLGEEEPANG